MRSGALDVLPGAALYVCGLLLAQVAYAFRRNADYAAVGRELASLGDDGARGDYRAFTDLRAVEDSGAHADEAIVLDLTPVHDCLVADHTPLAHDSRVARVSVEHATVLDVRPRSDTDRLRVTAQHGPIPDARLLPQMNVPDDIGTGRDPRRFWELREDVAVWKQVAVLVQIQRRTLALYCRYSSEFRTPSTNYPSLTGVAVK